jgi:Zn-dependent protease with chaperone function
MILWAFLLAFLLRLIPLPTSNNFQGRWYYNLLLFMLPPLFLLMTALAILSMGFQGEMLGLKIIWLGNFLAIIFLTFVIFYASKLIIQNIIIRKKINGYPQKLVLGRLTRILNTDFPYCAQIGILKPQLVLSEGLLNILNNEHLEAVLLHEEAHNYYQDSLSFFCLNWLKDFSFWLPNTELLWQDLLLLREMRADQKAALKIKPLIVAEALLIVAQNAISIPCKLATPFSIPTPINRLATRIDALVLEQSDYHNYGYHYWLWPLMLLIIFAPWVTILLHN